MKPVPLPFDRAQLHDELRRATLKVRREEAYEDVKKIQSAIEEVLHKLDYASLVKSTREAAYEGRNSVVLFCFRKTQMWSSFPLLFLVKGPTRDRGEGRGRDYFAYHGILSLMDRLERLLTPFRVHHDYDRDTGINTISVSWM